MLIKKRKKRNCGCDRPGIDPSECVRNCFAARERCVAEAITRCGQNPVCIEPCFREQTRCIVGSRPGPGC
jgi:hypothetical protein